MAHQFAAGLGITDHRSGRLEYLPRDAAHVGQLARGESPHADAEFAVHEVGDQDDFGPAGRRVIPDEEAPSVARQVVEPVDVDP